MFMLYVVSVLLLQTDLTSDVWNIMAIPTLTFREMAKEEFEFY
jgi:hypothetical protein